jgi:hypothetical protein
MIPSKTGVKLCDQCGDIIVTEGEEYYLRWSLGGRNKVVARLCSAECLQEHVLKNLFHEIIEKKVRSQLGWLTEEFTQYVNRMFDEG